MDPSTAVSLNHADPQARPTSIRHAVIGVTAFAAFLMYLDRMCLSQMVNADTFQHDLNLSKEAIAKVLGIFFFAYALGQMPAGLLADRVSTRPLVTILIAIWSGFTLLTGFSTGFWTLILARIGCGLAEAGAYPASGSLVPRWAPLDGRGAASGIISAGGRLGGAVAPWLTAVAIVSLGGWRVPGWIFGSVGVVFAGVFWFVVRDRPSDHPGCNAAERDLVERDLPPELRHAPAAGGRTPMADYLLSTMRLLWGLIRSRDMWLMCLYQNLTNVGWVFLVTLMPTFLKQSKGMSEVAAGRMATFALFAGLIGMLSGGWITDALVRRFGLKQGRMIPMAWSRFIAAAAYLLCLQFTSGWFAVIAFGVVAAMTDIGIPAVWGYTQDVGGRNIATVFAWPNMWGNFGAALTPLVLTWINKRFDPNHNWHASLLFLAGAFVLSGFVAFGIRADVKIKGAGGEAEAMQRRGFEVLPATESAS